MPQLTELCDIWRMLGAYEGGKEMGAAYTRVPCLRVPLSTFDKLAASLSAATTGTSPSEYFRSQARQATAVFLIPAWVGVQEDDELRYGRRIDVSGAVQPYSYTVVGIRDYDGIAYQDAKALFCQRNQ